VPDAPPALAAALKDRYTLERELGRGGMATVYLAQDLKHERPVALKVLLPELAHSLGPERFQREIKLAARLQHPHILTVLDSGEAAGRLWFTMPFVDGESLRDRLRREGQLPVDDALGIGREAAQALHYAHQHGVVHRDIKPENILLTADGSTLVADFGVARVLEAGPDDTLTQAGMAIGTPAYMSPEQASGAPADGRSDLYSLGCVLYEMLAGEPPYTGASAQAVMAKRFSEPVPSVRRLRPSVPEATDHAIRRALATLPADRFATGAELAHAILPTAATPTAMPTVPTAAAAAPYPAAPTGPAIRRVPAAAVALGLGFLLGLGALFAWRRSHGAGGEDGAPKRIAVLPFENAGDSSDAYFTDGITDEVRGKLASIPGLEVVASRTSNAYRHTNKDVTEIAKALGTEYLLVGTVRWARAPGGGSRVRVSPELIRLTPGSAPSTRWEQPFDAALTDVFQVQADIASRVAEALNLTLGAGASHALAAIPTKSPEAHVLYLRANEYYSHEEPTDNEVAIQLYHQSIALDSGFALAWARLAEAEAFAYWDRWDPSPKRLANAEAAARRALALQPDLPRAHLAMGFCRYWGYRDYEHALAEFAVVARTEPNDPDLIEAVGLVQRRQGKWPEAMLSLKRAVQLDPLNYSALYALGETYETIRDYPQAETVLTRAIEVAPDAPEAYGQQMVVSMNSSGSLDRARTVMRDALRHMSFGKLMAGVPFPIAEMLAADSAYANELNALSPAPFQADSEDYFRLKMNAYRFRGDTGRARLLADSLATVERALVRARPDDAEAHWRLGTVSAYLGDRAGAVREGRRAVELLPVSRDAIDGTLPLRALAEVYTVLGERDAAVDQLTALLAVPSIFSGASLRIDPTFASLRTNPRFQRLTAAH
jgi:serine/threonine-protein kinase